MALVATTLRGAREVPPGVARYIVDEAGTGCEFAITVADECHDSGLAGLLMSRLIGMARARGLSPNCHAAPIRSDNAREARPSYSLPQRR